MNHELNYRGIVTADFNGRPTRLQAESSKDETLYGSLAKMDTIVPVTSSHDQENEKGT